MTVVGIVQDQPQARVIFAPPLSYVADTLPGWNSH
jgi:hypothetical protein